MDASRDRPLAAVTGASSGIGFELARQFADHGYDLIVAAEDDELAGAAERLRASGATVEAVQVDLATDAGVDELYGEIVAAGRPLDAIALNAGVGAGGAFAAAPDGDGGGGHAHGHDHTTELTDELRVIDVNVRSTVHLAKHVAADMAERRRGRILLTSSIASTMPGPFQAVYNASKSFVQSFALGLRAELRDTGVTVTSLMPGPTDTEFFRRAGLEDTRLGQGSKDDPAEVARMGYEALMEGRERVVAASLMSRLQGHGSRLLPDRAKAAFHSLMAKPGSGARG